MRTLINYVITRQEQALGASLNWLHELARASLAAVLKFALAGPLGTHRKRLPKDAWHIARLASTQHEDCGGCVQIVVNLALRDEVRPELLEAVLRGEEEALPSELAEVYRFTETIVSGGDDPHLRESLRGRFGDEAFHELAIAIATSRLIPTTKRALGCAESCSLMPVKLRALGQTLANTP